MEWLDRTFLRIEVGRNLYYGGGGYDVYMYHEHHDWHATMRITDRWLRRQARPYQLIDDLKLAQLLVAARLTDSREVPSNGPLKVADGVSITLAA